MNPFAYGLQRSAFVESFFYVILHGLDVVICGGLEMLNAQCCCFVKLGCDRINEFAILSTEGRELWHALEIAQKLHPTALHLCSEFHQPKFAAELS